MTTPPVTPLHLILMPAYALTVAGLATLAGGQLGHWTPTALLIGGCVGMGLVRLTGRRVHAHVAKLAERALRRLTTAENRIISRQDTAQ